jgi:hypothetical protein
LETDQEESDPINQGDAKDFSEKAVHRHKRAANRAKVLQGLVKGAEANRQGTSSVCVVVGQKDKVVIGTKLKESDFK